MYCNNVLEKKSFVNRDFTLSPSLAVASSEIVGPRETSAFPRAEASASDRNRLEPWQNLLLFEILN